MQEASSRHRVVDLGMAWELASECGEKVMCESVRLGRLGKSVESSLGEFPTKLVSLSTVRHLFPLAEHAPVCLDTPGGRGLHGRLCLSRPGPVRSRLPPLAADAILPHVSCARSSRLESTIRPGKESTSAELHLLRALRPSSHLIPDSLLSLPPGSGCLRYS